MELDFLFRLSASDYVVEKQCSGFEDGHDFQHHHHLDVVKL
jgi:hypothetical protein